MPLNISAGSSAAGTSIAQTRRGPRRHRESP
jgi:hypothetical protein